MKTDKIAYIAGIFDGEGYVDIYNASTSKASKSPSLYLRVIISQKDGLIMNFLKDNFGGYVLTEKRGDNYIYRWCLASQKAHKFLSLILPYVLIKKEQVKLALKFEEQKGKYLETLKGSQGFRQLTDEEINWRHEIKEELKQLKKHYILYTEE